MPNSGGPRSAPVWLRAEVMGDAGVQHRALADAARTVEQRQPRRHQVGGDDFPLGVTTEEEGGLLLGERHQPGVRALTHAAPPRPPAGSLRSSRAACSGRDVARRGRCRGCPRRAGPRTSGRASVGCRWMAHDL